MGSSPLDAASRRREAKSALSERPVGSPEWLIGEVLSFRGAAVVLEPPDLRARVADRARELERLFRGAGTKTRI